MSGSGNMLRVGILRLRCQEPRRYFLTFLNSAGAGGLSSSLSEQAARTEASEPSRSPDFAASSFLLRLPLPLASLAPEQPLLRVELFAAPGLEVAGLDAGGSQSGGTLVASGLVVCGSLGDPDATARLMQGQRVTLTVPLAAADATAATAAADPVGEVMGSARGLAADEALLELVLLDAKSSSSGAGAGGGGGGAGEAAGGGPSAEALEALARECLDRQAALGKVARQLDSAAAHSEMVAWRLVDAEKRCRSLTEDNNRLQQLLHAEQQAWRIPQLRMLVDSAMLSREELIDRCESIMAAYGRERARNGELVERLKLLHAEQVDALELKKRYQQLQEAHEAQARAYSETDEPGGRVAQLRTTIKTQEEIIRNLEALLARAVQKSKPRAQDAAAEQSAYPDAGSAAGQDRQQPQDDAAAAVATAAVAAAEAAAAELRAQLAAAAQRVGQLEAEALTQQAAAAERAAQMEAEAQREEAAERIRRMEAELEALRQHTVTEFPALGLDPVEAEASPNSAPPLPAAAEASGRAPSRERPGSRGESGDGDGIGPDQAERAEADGQQQQRKKQPLSDGGEEEVKGTGKRATEEGVGKGEGEGGSAAEAGQDGDPKGVQQTSEGEAGAGLVGELRDRVQQLEAELAEAQEHIRELSSKGADAGAKEGGATEAEEELRRLHTEVAQLSEDKTAALLRAEYAEGAAEAAQTELVEVTRKYAREIASLKTRLAEKDAMMMGGFGGLEQLSSAARPDPPFPAFPPLTAFPDPAAAGSAAGRSGGGGAAAAAAPPPRSGGGLRGSGSARATPDARSVPIPAQSPSPVPPGFTASAVAAVAEAAAGSSPGRVGQRRASRAQSLARQQQGSESGGSVQGQSGLLVGPGRSGESSRRQSEEPTQGASGGEAAAAGGGGGGGGGTLESGASGRPLVWMKSRRGRVGGRSSRKEDEAAAPEPSAGS